MAKYIAIHTVKMDKPLIVEAEQWRNPQKLPPLVGVGEVDAASRTAKVQTTDGDTEMRVTDWATRILQPMEGMVGNKQVKHENLGGVYVCSDVVFKRTYKPWLEKE